MRLRLLLLPVLFIAFTLQAQTPTINWIKKNGPLGGSVVDMEVDPATGKIFLLDGNYRPYVSVDNGNSWQQLTLSGDNSINDIEITNGTIFLVAGYTLYASTDGGITFPERMTSASPYDGAQKLKRMPSSGNLVVLAYQALYTSSDDGVTWTLRNSTLADADWRYLAVNSVDQIFILSQNATFQMRPFRSIDGGVSFSEASTGIPVGPVLGLYAENNGAKVYVTAGSDIFSSTNGTSWTSVKTGSITDPVISDFGSYNNAIIEFSADGLGMFFIDNLNHKLHSKTLAATDWELQATDFPSATMSVSSVSAKDFPGATSATAFFGTPSGVFKTTTGGASVTQTNSGIANVNAKQLITDSSNDLYLWTESVGILKSQDDGNSWASVSNLPTTDLAYFFNNTTGTLLYAVSNTNILYQSYDRGTSWINMGNFSWAAAPNGEKVFALQNFGAPLSLFYSSDNANSWTATPVTVTGLPASFSINNSYDGTRIGFASASRMLLYLHDYATSEDDYYRIDFTYDAGNAITAAVASKITTMPIAAIDIQQVAIGNGKIYVYDTHSASADRVAISADGGITWVVRGVPQSDNFFVGENGYLFFTDGNGAKIHISRDDALTFIETSLPPAVSAWDLRDITLDNSGFAYLAFRADYLYQSANTIVLPSPPSGLEEIGYTATAAALRWVDLNEYDREIIIERSVNGVDFTVAGQVGGWDACYDSKRGYFFDENLLPNTTYTYRIKAKNAAGESAPTSTISFTTPTDCVQSIPENRSWSAINSGLEGYPALGAPVSVGIKHLGGGKYEITDLSLGLTGSPERAVFHESCGQTFVGSDGDVNPNGIGSWDGTNTLTLKWRSCYGDKTETITLTLSATDPVPAKPAALYAYVASNTGIEIKWPTSYYEKTYILERSVSAVSGFTQIASVNYPEASYTDNGPLTAGTTYYYRMKTLNGNVTPNESPYSNVASVPFNTPNFVVADNAITDYYSATIGSIWADFNNDGLMDYLTMQYDARNQLAKPRIFKNLGSGSFAQMDIDLGDGAYFLPSVTDYDNDHFPDIAFNGDQTRVLDLFKGNGDFTFAKVPAAGLGDLAVIEKTVSYTSWADINNDGLADLLTLNDEDGSFTLYRQNANYSFTKIMQGPATGNETVLSVWADYDNDGYQDVFFGNQDEGGSPGELYKNNGDETFTKITGNGLNPTNLFCAAWGDYNSDGNMDLFCGTMTLNALYQNNGDGTFTKDETTSISEASFTTSASWGDFNNDGYLDLMTVSLPFVGSQSRLFLRDPAITTHVAFKKIITEKINDASIAHYTVANADPDQNGLLDLGMSAFILQDLDDELLPANNNFYQNNNLPRNWTEVSLNPLPGKNTEALGARITVNAGGRTQMREIAAGSSIVSRNSTIAHFGLGATSVITNIQVKWPNGSIQNYPLPPANQILVIDEDVTGPAITAHVPANNATAVSPNTTITLVFDEFPFAAPGKMIHVTKVGETTPFASVDVTTGTKTGNQFVYTLSAPLEPLTAYNVTVDAGAFRDRYTNASAEMTTGTWKFQTTNAPAIITLAPAHNALDVSALTTLSVTFDKPITAVSGKSVNVYKSTDLTTPIQTIDASAATITGNTAVFTLSTKLQRSTTYHVGIDAGAFIDAESIASLALASSDWVLTTDPGPSYTFLPAFNDLDVAVDASLQITFTENVIRTAGKNIKVMDGASVISEGDVSVVGTFAANVYSYPAPDSGWPYGKVLKVTLDEGAFVDDQGNDCAPVATDSWTFTTIEAPDATPPVIDFTVPGSPAKGFASISPVITVSDNKTVNSVIISIRKISESSFTALTATAGATANTYTVTLSETAHFDAIGAEFYITATDLAGNTSRHPAEPGTHKVYLTYNETQSAIPTSSLGVGGRKQDWKVFAIPFELPAPKNEVTELFNEFQGLTNKQDYRLISLGGDRVWSEYSTDFTTLSRGAGYFINFRTNPGIIKLYNDLQAPANSRLNLYQMNLKKGWNMIGNPYLTAISWDDVAAINGLSGTEAQLKTFSGGTYTNNQTLAPYQGGFVLMEAAKTISIPFEGQTASGGRRGVRTLGDDISAEAWALAVTINQDNFTYTLGGVGMAPDASPGIDNYDDVTPPRFFDYLELNFSHPEHVAKHFTREIVPTQQSYTWDFTIDSNLEGLAALAWNNASLMRSGRDIFLLDVSTQTLVDMKATGTHSFDPKESSQFRIYFGDHLSIAPERVHLGKAYPNPSNGITTIGFSLPETGGLNQSVDLDIVDALGRTIGTIQQGRFNPGYHEAAFDASTLMKGFYTYRLTVKNRQGQKTEAHKLIIK